MKPAALNRVCYVTLGLLFSATSYAQVVQFPVSFEASAAVLNATERAQVTSHVQAAGAIWMSNLVIGGNRSLEIVVGLDDTRPTANAGSVTSAFVANIMGRDTFEQGAAAELRTGVDPNGAADDIRITFNTTYLRNELWFDPNPSARVDPVPTNRTDAMSVVLHELGHAFAYNGFANLSNGQPPATFWSSFDRWIQPGANPTFAGPAAVAAYGTGTFLTIGNLFHWGNPGVVLNADTGTPPSMNADTAVARALAVDPLVPQLMNGVVFFRGQRYAISALDRGVLSDVGLSLGAPPNAIFANGFEN